MVLNKRNKIRLTSLEPDKGIERVPKKFNKISIGYSETNGDSDDEETAPITLVKEKKQKHPIKKKGNQDNQDNHDSVSHGLYSNIFKRNPKPKIMNLEDIDDDQDDDSDDDNDDIHSIIPTKTEIEKIKQQKFKSMSGSGHDKYIREKDYVALLDKDDKSEIIDIIKKQGGGTDDDPWAETGLPDEFEDERLPLTDAAQLTHSQQKKQLIEDALNEQQDETSRQWESQILSKISSNVNKSIHQGPSLPKLYPRVQTDEHNEDVLQSRMELLRRRKNRLEMQLKVLEQKRLTMENTRNSKISQLT